jgi:hypothetical protein
MQARVIKVKTGMAQPTGWHYHVCDAVFISVLNGWVEGESPTGQNFAPRPVRRFSSPAV